jgi:hypothetical protein
MMMSRPDAFIQIGAFYAAVLLFADGASRRRELAWRAVRASAVAAVLYLPWLIWATWYYGTPVPHTIVAKGLGLTTGLFGMLHSIAIAPGKIIAYGAFHRVLFAPSNIELAPWQEWGFAANSIWLLMAIPVWYHWINPWGSRWARTVSLWLFLDSIYAICVPGAPWYDPPYALVAMIAWGFLIQDIVGWIKSDGGVARMPRAASFGRLLPFAVLAVVAFQLGVSLLMANAMRLQQTIIENGNRRSIGLWLRKNAAPNDSVFLEPLGYIGYFPNLKRCDFPGLSPREMIAARKKLGVDDYDLLIKEPNPVWIVLRPNEVSRVLSRSPGLLSDGNSGGYRLTRVYDQAARVSALEDMPGRSLLAYDQTFLVYHRTH